MYTAAAPPWASVRPSEGPGGVPGRTRTYPMRPAFVRQPVAACGPLWQPPADRERLPSPLARCHTKDGSRVPAEPRSRNSGSRRREPLRRSATAARQPSPASHWSPRMATRHWEPQWSVPGMFPDPGEGRQTPKGAESAESRCVQRNVHYMLEKVTLKINKTILY